MLEWWVELPARYNDALIITAGLVLLGGWAFVMDWIQEQDK